MMKEDAAKKIRVCCFCERWESGGIESFLHNVLLRMDLTNMEVDLVAAQMKKSVFSQRLQEHGVRFRVLSGSQRNVPENHRLFQKLLRERQYDVVHLNIFQGMSLYYAHLAKQAGIPVRIAHSHNTDLRKSPTRQMKIQLHRMYSNCYSADATVFWACSRSAAEFMFPAWLLEERGFTFIPNGIDTGKFRFDPAVREVVRQKLGLTNRFVIGNIGRLCYQKNQVFLIDVIAEAIKLRPESCLLLVGEGEDLDMLQEKVRALNMQNQVVFYGVSDNVEKLMWAMDAFVFPSRFEGLGIVAVEAQTAGLPTICSECVPKEAMITPLIRQALLTDGPAAWTNALLMAADAERKSGADMIAAAGFDVATVAAMIEKTYKEKC